MMAAINYKINSRSLTAFAPLHDELHFESDKNYLFDLSYLGCLEVIGEKAQEFLQGQLTCDLREVNAQQIQQGALCNMKGRVLALMDILHWQKHGLNLILPMDLQDETQASLAKTAMFSRVSLKKNKNYKIFGFYLQNEQDLLPYQQILNTKPYTVTSQDNFCCYALDNNIYIIVIDVKNVSQLEEQFKTQVRGSLAWHLLRLQQNVIEIYPESRGLFLPHRLDLHLLGYLNFNKGCYKGQEIIARTHYRAKLKHGLKEFNIMTNETLQSGQRVFDESGIELGELIDFCPIDTHKFLIAISILLEHPMTVQIENHKKLTVLQPIS